MDCFCWRRIAQHISDDQDVMHCNLPFLAAEHRTSAVRESPHSSTHHSALASTCHGIATWISAGLVCLGWRPPNQLIKGPLRWYTDIHHRDMKWICEYKRLNSPYIYISYVNLMLFWLWLLMFIFLIFLTTWRLWDGNAFFCVQYYSGQFMPNLLEDRSQDFFAPLRPYRPVMP